MIRVLSAFAIALFATQAHAAKSVTELSCRTTEAFMDSGINRFQFRVENLEAGKLSYAYLDQEAEDEYQVVRVASPKEAYASRISTLNDNWSIRRIKDGIRMWGDGDGCEYVTLVLYKDKDYKNGFVRVEGDTGCGNGSGYVTVRCTRKEIK